LSYLLHNGPVVFLAYLAIMLAGAWAIGRALAATWRPWWQYLPYSVLLGLSGRLVFWMLSGGSSEQFWEGFSDIYLDFAVLVGMSAAAYRLIQARKMVTQYPWLYEPAGPFGWRRIAPSRPK
jgi:hypothetical protein